MKKLCLFICLTVFLSINLFAQTEPTDTDGDGYRNVSTLDHLKWISQTLSGWSYNYELDNDINAAATRNWNDTLGFSPIGYYWTVGFEGKFNGNDHIIDSLFINRPTQEEVGLFGYTHGGEIINIGLTNLSIKGKQYVGGLVGRHGGTNISNCYSTGNVTGSSNFVGGLVGYIMSSTSKSDTISNCYSKVSVSGGGSSVGGLVGESSSYFTISNSYCTGNVTGSSLYVGGLVGSSSGHSTINNSYSTGSVTGSSDYVGGLVGSVYSSCIVSNSFSTGGVTGSGRFVGGLVGYNYESSIRNSYSTGSVTGSSSYVGGLVGLNQVAIISNCYSTGNVTGSSNLVGGFVGYNYASSTISSSYSTGIVSGSTNVGGFCGLNGNIISDSFWDIQTSGIDSSAGGTGKTTTQMKTQSTFTNWDFDSTWSITSQVNDGYPYLQGFGFEATDSNLIKNPSCELPLVDENIPYWDEVIGTNWTRRGNDAYHGDYYFFANNSSFAELSQFVDLSNFSESIDNQNILFDFSAQLKSFPQSPNDQAKIILEYWNFDKSNRLDTFDFGYYQNIIWTKISKTFTPPINTIWINIRLISKRNEGLNNDGYFDDLYLTVIDSVERLETPNLVSPLDNATNQELSLALIWNSVSEASSFDFQLSDDSLFASTIQNINLSDTTIIVGSLNNSTTYYWHVRAMNSSDTSDWSEVWSFTTKSAGVIEPPSSWAFTDITGSNSTVIILKNIYPKIENRDFQNGDAVGFFFKRNDSLICAGYGVWNNANLAVTVWGDDSETALKDGFANNEGYTIKIWDGQLGRELNVEVTYSSGNSYFVDDGISYIGFLKGVSSITQNIYIAKGWNMISSYVNPDNDSLEVMFDDISNNLTILKNNAGQVFIPSYEINGIGKWNINHGYKAYMSVADTLKITGLALQPSDNPIIMNSGWNLVSYLRNSAKDVSECLTTLTESASLTIAKNNAGQVYIPTYDINSIGNMLPGQGYQMYLSAKDTLIYPANSAGRSSSNQLTPMPKYILPEYTETGNSAVLVIEIAGTNGDEVAVYNKRDEVIGSGVIHNNKVAVTIWGDNDQTPETDGAIANYELRIKNYDVKSGRFSEITLSNILNVVDDNLENSLNYKQDAIYFAKGKIEDNSNKLSLNVTPNPANDYIEITIEGDNNNSSLKLFTNTGKLIADISTELNSMSGNKIRFNTSGLSSGSYNLILTSDNNKLMKQIIIIK